MDQPTGRTSGRPALGVLILPALCVLLVPAAAWLDSLAPASGPGVEIAAGDGWAWALMGALLGVLAGIVLIHDRRQLFGWVLAGFGLFWSLDGFAQSYIHAGLTSTGAWPGMTLALWFLNRFGAYLTVVTAVLLMVFPTGRFLPGRWAVACRVAVALMVSAGLTFLVIPSAGRMRAQLPPDVDPDPTSIDALAGVADTLVSISLATMVSTLVFALVTVFVRYRRSQGAARDQMRWLAWSAVVLLVAVPAGAVFQVPGIDYLTLLLVTVLPPAAMTVAIVRPSVLPIQELLGRTVVLAVVVAVLVAADALVLAALTLLLDDELTQAQVVAVVLAVAVLLYGPLRFRLSAAVRRRILGERGRRYDAVAGLASTLESTDDASDQLGAVASAVAAAFGVTFVSVEVDRGPDDRVVVTHGSRPDAVRLLPIAYRGRPVGRLVLPARGLRSRLSARDERLLGDLVRQAATAVRTAQLAEELQRSRERLVAAREEERRRIRRDLHDGLGPTLSGIVFAVDAARITLDRDPAGAADQLAAVSAQAQEVVADVRRLVHDLRPPALDDRGLVGALRQQAEALAVPLRVRVADDVPAPLPAAVEVAAFRIAGEALVNVSRHAEAASAALCLERDGADLVLVVADDGVGIAAEAVAGVGLVSMRERAEELGGSLDVSCPEPRGTRVRVRLPLGASVVHEGSR
ncbi:sensor histidine kinase [Nocardioides sambongensis]|uniref:sensor histidine kinase n=1 Tax=Nocardioides sambongensis TaxID=2589074 RepID=UPI0011299D91|nr:sensor histidine kinase [Nocardioides sambongensis]